MGGGGVGKESVMFLPSVLLGQQGTQVFKKCSCIRKVHRLRYKGAFYVINKNVPFKLKFCHLHQPIAGTPSRWAGQRNTTCLEIVDIYSAPSSRRQGHILFE